VSITPCISSRFPVLNASTAANPGTAFAAFLLPLLLQRFGRVAATLAAPAAVIGSCLALVLQLAPAAFAGETQLARLAWLPAYGLDLSLRMDGLGLLFSLLICGIGLLVVLYAFWYYLPGSDRIGRFYSILLLFMAAMLGVVLSENLLLLLVFWEITSLSSFLLVAYRQRQVRVANRRPHGPGGHRRRRPGIARRHPAARPYRRQLRAVGDPGSRRPIRAHALYAPTLILILLGAFTKSAQFPFHFWLPNAMAAPTPVSAYLHSATMVKAGVFLLARLYPALGGSDLWFWLVSGTGAVTLVYSAAIGAFSARHQGPARLLDDQPSGPDHPALRSRHAAVGGRRRLSHHQPRHLQGLAVHGRRRHRPRMRHARHAPGQWHVQTHADHRHAWRSSPPVRWPAYRCSTAS
jgi:multicomponent K+:H+ antiporter subunit A